MTLYDYNLDEITLEVFPAEIWNDPFIVFHGTSSFHSFYIENNGFIRCHCPFELDDARELVRFMSLPSVAPFDTPSRFGTTQAQALNNYVHGIENCNFRLSFSYLSYECVLFSSGQSKGGQTIGTIRSAKNIITNAILANAISNLDVTEPINRLFELAESINNSDGVIYAVKIPENLSGIQVQNNVVYSENSILPDSVVGKVVLPANVNPNLIERGSIVNKLKSKLFGRNGLGVIYNRMGY